MGHAEKAYFPGQEKSHAHETRSNCRQRHPAARARDVRRHGGKLGEYSDANTGLRAPCPNIHPKNVWMKIRIHFGDGFSGSSEEGCFPALLLFCLLASASFVLLLT